MIRVLGCGAVLLLSVCVLAACGSGHFSPAQRAAISSAQRHDNIYRIFPDGPGTTSCRIPAGGPGPGGYFPGHCTTTVSMSARRIRLDFVERFSGDSATFTVVLDPRDRIVGEHWHGDPPQLRN